MKLVKSIIAITVLIITLVLASLFFTSSVDASNNEILTDDSYTESIYVDELIYPHDEVVDVNIEIDEETYATLLENASDSEYYTCNITYNGITLNNVAIRTKGNSSLKDVVEADGDRFSFNIDLNYYLDQDMYGIDKIILNNLFKDPTMMAEYITYEALASIDAVSSRTTFTALYINDEYYGIYLSVEQVGNEFLETNFGNSDNELYKPDVGVGSSLDYVSSDGSFYTGLIDENSDDTTNEAITELLEAIATGENLDTLFDVDGYLKYLAVSTYTVNLDSYQGGMWHNYYLYNNEGTFEWIAWDLNMAFNGFPGVQITDEQATEFLIDEPVVNSLSNYPLIDAIFENEEYVAQYHVYLQELLDNYFDNDTFTQRVIELDSMIDSYVKSDSNSFFSYMFYKESLFEESTTQYSLLQFVEARSENIALQLSGEILSTNDGLGNIVSGVTMPGNNLPNIPQGGIGDRPTRVDNNLVLTPDQETTTNDNPLTTDDSTEDTVETSLIIPTVLGGAALIGFVYFLSRKFD